MKKLNWNSIVKVKLTPHGKDIYYHRFDEMIARGVNLKPEYPKIDKDGFTEFQLWSFMHIFGHYIHMAAKDVVEEIYFYIDDCDLEEAAHFE